MNTTKQRGELIETTACHDVEKEAFSLGMGAERKPTGIYVWVETSGMSDWQFRDSIRHLKAIGRLREREAARKAQGF